MYVAVFFLQMALYNVAAAVVCFSFPTVTLSGFNNVGEVNVCETIKAVKLSS